jgi:dTDP-4-amino-4,6-dideoxygalactose transaminase
VDVSPENFCIDPEKAEAAITRDTTAILAVHAYGFPCDVERLSRIARDRGLALIYDAAPCFGVRLKGVSLARFGDAAVLSFHGTKVFHTAEGGAVVCQSAELHDRCRLFTNFGIRNEWTVELAGLNGKLDEIRSALGLVNLKRVADGIRSRERVVRSYLEFFRSGPHESIRVNAHLYENPDVELNYSYFPIVVAPSAGMNRDILYQKLRERRIHSRTYYYPTVLDLPVYDRYDFRTEDVSNAAYLSRNVLCLPVNPYFDEEDIAYITGCLADILGKA